MPTTATGTTPTAPDAATTSTTPAANEGPSCSGQDKAYALTTSYQGPCLNSPARGTPAPAREPDTPEHQRGNHERNRTFG